MEHLLFIAFILIIFLFVQARKTNKSLQNPNYQKVDLMTLEFDDFGNPKQDEKGGYIMQLIKKDFILKIPIIINTEDQYIKPPFWEHNGKLWLYHSVVQKKDRINLIVLYAGSPEPEKSAFCADATKMEEINPITEQPKEMEVVK